MDEERDHDSSAELDAALRAVVEGVEADTGERFFYSLVRHLALALQCQYAFVSELNIERQVFRTLAVWGRGDFLPNFELPLAGTPCEAVLGGHPAHYPERLQQLFAEDTGLAVWKVDSYTGVPLLDGDGNCVGHLAIFDDRPMPNGQRNFAIMRIFASRARAEIERLKGATLLSTSEGRYRDLYQAAPLPIISLNPAGRIIACNRRFTEWSGLSEGEVLRLGFVDFSVPEAVVRRRELHTLVMSGRTVEEEIEVCPPGGHRCWIRLAQRPIRDARDQIVGAQAVFIDISERKQAESALKASEERLARIFDSAMDAIISFDSSGRVELFSLAAQRIFQCSGAEAIGQPLARFMTDALRQALTKITGEDTGRHASLDGVRARRANGEEFEIEATVSQTEIGGGKLFTLILRDIEQQRRQQEESRRLTLQNEYLQEELKEVLNADEIVGQSHALAQVLEKARIVAQTDATVLILGETGTGKELFARAVHNCSSRRSQPLIKVNCGALPTGLIESELFGHEKGAFTGATSRRIGRFELAHGGSIFLDEVAELPLELQSKLLRVLQEREFERVGGRETIKVDVRVIAATNRELTRAAEERTFRQDLYYRLNVFPLNLPSLRERKDDIPMLVHYFVQRYAAKIGRRILRVPRIVMERLVAYSWPGNIRELENVIERAVILSSGAELAVAPELLPAIKLSADVPNPPAPWSQQQAEDGVQRHASLDDAQREHILTTLRRTEWRIDGPAGAAHALQLNPSTLRSRMKKLGIRRD
jgi:PAS domain S-box-containing protein